MTEFLVFLQNTGKITNNQYVGKEFSNDSETWQRYRSLSVLLRNALRSFDFFQNTSKIPKTGIVVEICYDSKTLHNYKTSNVVLRNALRIPGIFSKYL